MTDVRATHDCPCGCGLQVPRHKFSCPAAWQRLPGEIKLAIVNGRRCGLGEHGEAIRRAQRWLRGADDRCEVVIPAADGGPGTRCRHPKDGDQDTCRAPWWAEP